MDQQTRACLNLWRATFALACKDYAADFALYMKNKKKNPDNQKSNYPAIRWVESDKEGVGTFRWMCELFDLDPDRARSALRVNVRKLVAV